jgi:hypothetical protein
MFMMVGHTVGILRLQHTADSRDERRGYDRASFIAGMDRMPFRSDLQLTRENSLIVDAHSGNKTSATQPNIAGHSPRVQRWANPWPSGAHWAEGGAFFWYFSFRC